MFYPNPLPLPSLAGAVVNHCCARNNQVCGRLAGDVDPAVQRSRAFEGPPAHDEGGLGVCQGQALCRQRRAGGAQAAQGRSPGESMRDVTPHRTFFHARRIDTSPADQIDRLLDRLYPNLSFVCDFFLEDLYSTDPTPETCA